MPPHKIAPSFSFSLSPSLSLFALFIFIFLVLLTACLMLAVNVRSLKHSQGGVLLSPEEFDAAASVNSTGLAILESMDPRCKVLTASGRPYAFRAPGLGAAPDPHTCLLMDNEHPLVGPGTSGCSMSNPNLAGKPLAGAAVRSDVLPGLKMCTLRFDPSMTDEDLQAYDEELMGATVRATPLYQNAAAEVAASKSKVASLTQQLAALNKSLGNTPAAVTPAQAAAIRADALCPLPSGGNFLQHCSQCSVQHDQAPTGAGNGSGP